MDSSSLLQYFLRQLRWEFALLAAVFVEAVIVFFLTGQPLAALFSLVFFLLFSVRAYKAFALVDLPGEVSAFDPAGLPGEMIGLFRAEMFAVSAALSYIAAASPVFDLGVLCVVILASIIFIRAAARAPARGGFADRITGYFSGGRALSKPEGMPANADSVWAALVFGFRYELGFISLLFFVAGIFMYRHAGVWQNRALGVLLIPLSALIALRIVMAGRRARRSMQPGRPESPEEIFLSLSRRAVPEATVLVIMGIAFISIGMGTVHGMVLNLPLIGLVLCLSARILRTIK